WAWLAHSTAVAGMPGHGLLTQQQHLECLGMACSLNSSSWNAWAWLAHSAAVAGMPGHGLLTQQQ
ncbi:hypothetical protein, partial [Pseudomonas sp. Pdm06]|uniref:hypothetical protein n=1 Tax=Pseudomonas sp. Pdm06 TaxID=1790044 RepID=UPI001CE116FB